MCRTAVEGLKGRDIFLFLRHDFWLLTCMNIIKYACIRPTCILGRTYIRRALNSFNWRALTINNHRSSGDSVWKVLKKCKAYSNISKKCNLCLYEKFIIICKKELCSLNRRNELASSCPHRNRYVLQNSRVT